MTSTQGVQPPGPGLQQLGFVVGLAAEARIAALFGYPVLIGGGTPEGAANAASQLVEKGVTALVSFGFAGGLDPGLQAGTVVIPTLVLFEGRLFAANPALAARFGGLTPHCLVAGTAIAANAATKRQLYIDTNAHAIDLESGSVAHIAQMHGLPFVVVRAISDPAERDLPPAALLPLDRQGGINLVGVLGSLLRQPTQLPALLKLASNAAQARRALVKLTSIKRNVQTNAACL